MRLVRVSLEPVAHASLGSQVARVLGFGLYLLSEVTDVPVDRTSTAGEMRTPKLPEAVTGWRSSPRGPLLHAV